MDDTTKHALRSQWYFEMECRYDVMPLWWWDNAQREAAFEEWLSAQATVIAQAAE